MKLGLVFACVLVAGCDELPKNEFQGAYTGVVTVVASGTAIGADGYAVTQPLDVRVTDPGYESGADIVMSVAPGCTLRAHWTKRARDTSRGSEVAFLFGDAEILSGQTCTINAVVLTTTFGNAHVDAGGAFTIDVAGNAVRLRGNPVPGGFVNVAFRGD